MYNLSIDLLTHFETVTVFTENNMTLEDILKTAFRWRLRPLSKYVDKIYVYIYPQDYDSDFTSTTSSNSNNTGSTDNLSCLIASDKTIKKKINLKYYGRFLHFLKNFCLKNEYGTFKISFHLDIEDSTCSDLLNLVTDYKNQIINKLSLFDVGIHTVDKKTQITCSSLIGLGAFGIVYKGHISNSNEEYAIKVIPFTTITNTSSIYREIFILDLMSAYPQLDPYVVKYYGAYMDSEFLYIVMEYLPGPSLSHYVSANSKQFENSIQSIYSKKQHVRNLKNIASHLSEGVKVLHSIGISHRDIKPGNIMGCTKGTFKLVDFGFAALSPSLKANNTLKWDDKIVGTFRFSPAEVLSHANNIDWFKADFWSLGTVVYYVMTGKHFLDQSSKDRHEMLNALHRRMKGSKPLFIEFYTGVFSSSTKSSYIKKYKNKCENLMHGLLEYNPQNRTNEFK